MQVLRYMHLHMRLAMFSNTCIDLAAVQPGPAGKPARRACARGAPTGRLAMGSLAPEESYYMCALHV